MLFHIAASDGAGPEAWWNAPLNYTKNLTLDLATAFTAAGPAIHQAAVPHESYRILRGMAHLEREQVADAETVRDSTKTLWDFADGARVWRVRCRQWDLTPVGGNVYSLAFEFAVVARLK